MSLAAAFQAIAGVVADVAPRSARSPIVAGERAAAGRPFGPASGRASFAFTGDPRRPGVSAGLPQRSRPRALPALLLALAAWVAANPSPAHAESGQRARVPAASSGFGLYQCAGPDGGTIFRSTRGDGCVLLASPDPNAPDPQRWVPLMGVNGVISYLDQHSVRRRGTQLGVVLIRNAPTGGIHTASGEPIRSSLRRMVLNCATSMYAVVEQTLYPRRYARGEPLYTIRPARQAQVAAGGTIAAQVLDRLCQ